MSTDEKLGLAYLRVVMWVALSGMASMTAQAAGPRVRKVENPAPLKPLPLVTGGRVQVSASGAGEGAQQIYTAQWPGAYYEVGFRGREVYFRVGKAHEILHVVVDGRAPLKLVDPAPGTYRVAGLKNGPHQVRVAVVTESQQAPNEFDGFAIPEREQAVAMTRRPRQIEFIGDSHTVGYGNTSATQTCTNEQVWATTDTSQAFGTAVADHYNADFQVNAISGHGVVRNYNGTAGDPVPVAYPYLLLDKQQKYEDPAWHPEVIVISLGTNDFSTALHEGEPWTTREALHADYEKTYVQFVQSLRARDPEALIILWATDMEHGEIAAEVKAVVDQLRALGDARVNFLPMDKLAFSGCHSHPSVADDRRIAEALEGVIDATPDVWEGK